MEALDATPVGMLTAAVRLNEAAKGLEPRLEAAFRRLALSYYGQACALMAAPVTGPGAAATAPVSDVE